MRRHGRRRGSEDGRFSLRDKNLTTECRSGRQATLSPPSRHPVGRSGRHGSRRRDFVKLERSRRPRYPESRSGRQGGNERTTHSRTKEATKLRTAHTDMKEGRDCGECLPGGSKEGKEMTSVIPVSRSGRQVTCKCLHQHNSPVAVGAGSRQEGRNVMKSCQSSTPVAVGAGWLRRASACINRNCIPIAVGAGHRRRSSTCYIRNCIPVAVGAGHRYTSLICDICHFRDCSPRSVARHRRSTHDDDEDDEDDDEAGKVEMVAKAERQQRQPRQDPQGGNGNGELLKDVEKVTESTKKMSKKKVGWPPEKSK